MSVSVAVTPTGAGNSATGGDLTTFEICGFVRSAPLAVVNDHAEAWESGFPGSLASVAETLIEARYIVVGERVGTGSIVRTVSPPLQLYVTGIHARLAVSWSVAVAGVAVAVRFIDSLNVTITFVVVEITEEPFGGVCPLTEGAFESIKKAGVTAHPWFPAGSTTVTLTKTDVAFSRGTDQVTECGFVDPTIGPAIGVDGPPVV